MHDIYCLKCTGHNCTKSLRVSPNERAGPNAGPAPPDEREIVATPAQHCPTHGLRRAGQHTEPTRYTEPGKSSLPPKHGHADTKDHAGPAPPDERLIVANPALFPARPYGTFSTNGNSSNASLALNT